MELQGILKLEILSSLYIWVLRFFNWYFDGKEIFEPVSGNLFLKTCSVFIK